MDTEKIELGDNQWWEVKTHQTYGERKAIKKQATDVLTESMRMESRSNDGTVSTEIVDMMQLQEEIEFQTLVISSVAWSWPDKLDRLNISIRDGWMIDVVLKRLNELYQRPEVKEKALGKN